MIDQNENKSSPTGLTYELKTYQDFMDLTTKQFNKMLIDFKMWRDQHDQIYNSTKMIADVIGVKVSEIVEFPDSFLWIDDGEHNGHTEISIKNKDGSVEAVIKTKNGEIKNDKS